MEPLIPNLSAPYLIWFLKPPASESVARLPLMRVRVIANSCETGGGGRSCRAAVVPVVISRRNGQLSLGMMYTDVIAMNGKRQERKQAVETCLDSAN